MLKFCFAPTFTKSDSRESYGIDLPLKAVHCEAKISGPIALVTIVQLYVNDSAKAIHVRYTFPIPNEAAVYAGEMWIGQKRLVAKVKPEEQARKEFAAKVAQGQQAMLMESARKNIFVMDLGNVQPGDEVEVKISYLDILDQSVDKADRISRLRIPLCPGIPYIPGKPLLRSSRGLGTPDTDQVPDASRITPPRIHGHDPRAAALSIDIASPAGGTLTSPTHGIYVKPLYGANGGPDRLQVGLSQEEAVPDKDFVLEWRESGAQEMVAYRRGSHALLKLVAPVQAIRSTKLGQNIYFLVDRSLSMEGVKWEKALEALKRFVAVLGDKDLIDIVFFCGVFDRFSDRLETRQALLSDEKFRNIEQYIHVGSATELLPPLKDMLKRIQENKTDRPSTIVLITDGEVGNSEPILDLLNTAPGPIVHTFGIDTAVNDTLLKEIARQQNGWCVLKTPQENFTEAVQLLAERVASPAYTQLRVDLPWKAASRIPPLYCGDVLALSLKLQGEAATEIKLRGINRDGQLRTWTIPLINDTDVALELLWAKEQIDELLRAKKKDQAIKLACQYNLSCPGASWVAWDEIKREKAEILINQPNLNPADWDMLASAPALMAKVSPSPVQSLPPKPASARNLPPKPVSSLILPAKPGSVPTPSAKSALVHIPPVKPGSPAHWGPPPAAKGVTGSISSQGPTGTQRLIYSETSADKSLAVPPQPAPPSLPSLEQYDFADEESRGVYDATQIRQLTGLEAVRFKPGMYLGGTDERALHECIAQVLSNSVDEHLTGHGKKIDVIIHHDGSISIRDEGRGISVEIHRPSAMPILELVLTQLHAGSKYSSGYTGYTYSGGAQGVGAKCVNAVSELFTVEVSRDGKVYGMEFKKGETTQTLHTIGTSTQTGTTIRFKPDPEIFKETTQFNREIIVARLRQLAFLCPGLELNFNDERDESKKERFYFAQGLEEYVAMVSKERQVLHPQPFRISTVKQKVINGVPRDIKVDIVLQFNDSPTKLVNCFTNTLYNPEGGTHFNGFLDGMTRALVLNYHFRHIPKPYDPTITNEDVLNGLVAVISLQHPEPRFASQLKQELISTDVQDIVSSLTYDGLNSFFDPNPHVSRQIVEKALAAAKARHVGAPLKPKTLTSPITSGPAVTDEEFISHYTQLLLPKLRERFDSTWLQPEKVRDFAAKATGIVDAVLEEKQASFDQKVRVRLIQHLLQELGLPNERVPRSEEVRKKQELDFPIWESNMRRLGLFQETENLPLLAELMLWTDYVSLEEANSLYSRLLLCTTEGQLAEVKKMFKIT